LIDHFDHHGIDLGLPDEVEYLRSADVFLGGPRPETTWECRRRNGDLLRYNPLTEEFGVLRPDNAISTYYLPDPAVHRCPNNGEYFRRECHK
jgi:filamentous hemagglutinin